jgi:hypothetical protein
LFAGAGRKCAPMRPPPFCTIPLILSKEDRCRFALCVSQNACRWPQIDEIFAAKRIVLGYRTGQGCEGGMAVGARGLRGGWAGREGRRPATPHPDRARSGVASSGCAGAWPGRPSCNATLLRSCRRLRRGGQKHDVPNNKHDPYAVWKCTGCGDCGW